METEAIKKRIAAFRRQELPRLTRLKNYYGGLHPIVAAAKEAGKPDNRLVNNFCKNITDSTVGYFMGKPVQYAATDELLRAVRALYDYNDEAYVNSRLSRDLSVFGRAYELLYYDRDRQIRFVPLDPTAVIPVFGDTPDEELVAAIRLLPEEDDGGLGLMTVEVYDEQFVWSYRYTEADGVMELQRKLPHYFGQVPVNPYRNNADGTGDFEPVLSLVDAYNTLQSESVNDFALFADSYLAISGMGGTEASDLAELRRNRVLLLDDGGDAKWLTKNVNDAYVENLKDRIASDIYRFSGSVDMSHGDLGGKEMSGVAMRFRLLNFENRVSVTERHFKRGLQRRLELICALWSLLGFPYDYREVTVTFTRNVPESPAEDAEYLEKLAALVSRRTILSQIPFVEDVNGELARLKEEDRDGE